MIYSQEVESEHWKDSCEALVARPVLNVTGDIEWTWFQQEFSKK